MKHRLLSLVIVIAGMLIAGCGIPSPTQPASRYIVLDDTPPDRPEVLLYESPRGDWLRVWGSGTTNLESAMTAHCDPINVGTIGNRYDVGAAYAGTYDHTPVVGDTLTGALLFTGPVVDSLHVTRGGFLVVCTAPDTLNGSSWIIVPPGHCGPDSIATFFQLVRTQ